MSKLIHIRMPEALVDDLDEARGSVPRTVVIRHAIHNFLYASGPPVVTREALLKAAEL